MKTFVTFPDLGRYGRAGNQMFQIAACIGISTHPKNGCDVKMPLWENHDHKERFNTTEAIDLYNYFENQLPLLTDADRQLIQYESHIGWGYHEVMIKGNTALYGHFQSEKYFAHCIDIVRYYLKMKNEFAPTDYCCLHFRAGDYDPNPNGYHPRCTIDYYAKAMKHFGSDQQYLVFTDDIAEAKKMFGLSDKIAYATGDYLQSWKAMKSCQHFICANSSYSLMAAILADQPGKQVVLPKKWFGPHVNLDTKDIYPEGAIVI